MLGRWLSCRGRRPRASGKQGHQALHSLMRSQFPERKFLLWHSTKALVGVWLQRPRALLAGAKQVCKMGIIGGRAARRRLRV